MKTSISHRILHAAFLASTLLAAPAMAADYCASGMATEGIAVGDMSFEGRVADDCYGVAIGNLNSKSGVSLLNGMNWGQGWTYLDGTREAGASFMGLQFEVTAAKTTGGSWTLTVVDENGAAALSLPALLDFAVGIKAGNEFSLWGFDDVVVDGADSGTFSIVFANKGGNNPALSHLLVFGREGSGGAISAVPEAKTYVMLLTGLALVGFAVRRRLG